MLVGFWEKLWRTKITDDEQEHTCWNQLNLIRVTLWVALSSWKRNTWTQLQFPSEHPRIDGAALNKRRLWLVEVSPFSFDGKRRLSVRNFGRLMGERRVAAQDKMLKMSLEGTVNGPNYGKHCASQWTVAKIEFNFVRVPFLRLIKKRKNNNRTTRSFVQSKYLLSRAFGQYPWVISK